MDEGSGNVGAFRVEPDGRLTAIPGIAVLAGGANGVAVR